MKPTTPFASNIWRRYRPEGKIVARRPIVVGDREVQIGEEIQESEFDARRRWLLWEQNWIDTPEPDPEPSDAELERMTAPSVPPPKPAPAKQQAATARR